VAVGKGVSVGSDSENEFALNEYSGGNVGVVNEGWKGVGVGVEFGADVINIKESGCSGAVCGATHDVTITLIINVRKIL